MSWKTVFGAIVALGIAAQPALACKGSNVLFEDNFSEEDPGWATGDAISVKDGAMHITAKPGYIMRTYYNGSQFEDADACVDVKNAEFKDPQSPPVAGIIFWGTDYNNYYMFWVSPIGVSGVSRMNNGKWASPVPARKADSINARPGASNSIRVTMTGQSATLYINDKKFVTFKGQPPKGGSLIGLEADSGDKDQDTTISFSNFKVTDVSK